MYRFGCKCKYLLLGALVALGVVSCVYDYTPQDRDIEGLDRPLVVIDGDIIGDAVDKGGALVQLCAKIELHGGSPFVIKRCFLCPPLLFGIKKRDMQKTYPGIASVLLQKQCSASFAGMIRIRFEGSRIAYSPLSLCSRLPRASF